MEDYSVETERDLAEFMKEFWIAKVRIAMLAQSEQLRKRIEGREMQHNRWRDIGHTFVFPGVTCVFPMTQDGH